MGTEYAWYLITMGRFDELIVEAQRLLLADPFSDVTRMTVINAYYYARRYDQSIEICQRIIQQDPMYTDAHWYLANNYEQLKQHDDAHQSRLSAMELSREAPEDIAAYDSLYNELGPKAYSTWQLMSRKNQKDWLNNNPVSAAGIYTKLGEKEKALDYLEKAYEKRDGPLITIKVSPRWDPLRAESRFQDLLKRMNFPG
jgi:tetratricopeptide (TPR) repeat protein